MSTAPFIVLTLENARLFRQVRRLEAQHRLVTESLHDAVYLVESRQDTSFLPTREIVGRIVAIHDSTAHKHAEVPLRRAHDALEYQVGARTAALAERARPVTLMAAVAMALTIVQERHAYLTNALCEDPRVPEPVWATREGLIAFAGYPLLVAGQMVGTMAVFARALFRLRFGDH